MNFSIWPMPSWEMARCSCSARVKALVLEDFLDVELDRGQGIPDLVGDRGRSRPIEASFSAWMSFLWASSIRSLAARSFALISLKLRARSPISSCDVDLDLVREIAPGDADRPVDELLERPGDPPGQKGRAENPDKKPPSADEDQDEPRFPDLRPHVLRDSPILTGPPFIGRARRRSESRFQNLRIFFARIETSWV